MNEFQHNEELGRAKFADFFKNKPKWTVTFTTDPYDHKDAWIKSAERTLAAEIKNRAPQYEYYDTYIMEKIKYNELEKLYKENTISEGMMAYFFGDTLYIFQLTKINQLIKKNRIRLQMQLLPDSTVNYTKKVWKECYMLPKAYSYQYQKKDNKWTLINKPF